MMTVLAASAFFPPSLFRFELALKTNSLRPLLSLHYHTEVEAGGGGREGNVARSFKSAGFENVLYTLSLQRKE